MMCGMCGHPGSHTVAQDPSLPLPTRCVEQCARCQQEEREEQEDA